MSLKERHRSISMRGLVCPTEWDDEGRACRVAIFTFDDDEYEVEPADAGSYLLDHVGQEVLVRAHFLPGHRKRKIIIVRSFTVYDAGSSETVEGDGGQPEWYNLDLSPPE